MECSVECINWFRKYLILLEEFKPNLVAIDSEWSLNLVESVYSTVVANNNFSVMVKGKVFGENLLWVD